ncbi:hypothetical protein J3459_014180 [Metarhizium acridum]|uniref:Uncharacterized protein n=1 Tax=Metarhizium acridum (strain CQMa 102) TaxID=655827 RepID=E9E7S9_METAQ|nr:uncharacterized protein MAC_05927 [Metarhizium acridum CQMa 102]EFY88063.1 hypothetical protein MAC_05927 [Metarhizium acridum CQMa 102]KAG8414631.1 hypothetical protein J3459_014180 [Metarhizium acridum]
MSPSEEPTYGAASIPAQQSTEENAATKENQMQKLYRSSLPSSSDSPSSQLPSKDQPHLSRTGSNLPVNAESETKADKQKDQDNSGDESNSTISNNSSANEKDDDDDMLSVRDLSSSSTSSLAMPTCDVPALPAKSSLRASRLLASIPQKRAPNDDQPMLPHAAPHQVYLSSEEDASSSADDFSDFDDEMESDGEGGSQKPSTRNMAREDTARVVAVVFHGKPSIVTLSPRRSISPSSSEVGQPRAGLLRTATEPSLQHQRPRSVSSATSTMKFHPPRASSMTTGFEKKRPHFLHIDPYAKVRDEAAEHLRGPMTPTSMFRRTLSLVKKRSKPNLHQSESQLTPMEKVGEVEEEDDPRESLCLESASLGPVSNQDVMRKAQRHGSVSSPRSEASSPISPKNRFRAGLSLGRQRSVKA